MFLENNNNNNNPTSLISEIKLNKFNYIFLIDTSITCTDAEFVKAKNCLEIFIQKVPEKSTVSIISFSDTASLITDNKNDKDSIKADIDALLYVGGTSTCKLNDALSIANTKIDSTNKTNNYLVILSNGPAAESPLNSIKNITLTGTEIIVIGFKDQTNTNYNTITSPSNILIYDSIGNLNNFIDNFTKVSPPIPFIYSFFYKDYNIQKSNEPLKISFKIKPTNRRAVFNENEVVVTIHPNDYYYGDEEVIESKIENKCPYIIDFELEPVNNSSTKDLPNRIDFDIKIKGKCYSGYFYLDLTKLVGDFATEFPLNIFVEGAPGHGKSALLNLIFNLFTSYQKIFNIIYSSKHPTHTTKKLEFYPIPRVLAELFKEDTLPPLISDVIKNINLVLVDKYGMKEGESNISYESAVKGCYHPDTVNEVNTSNKLYECHCIIFVISYQKITSDTDLKEIKLKIQEAISKGLQPILVLTFGDNLSSLEIQKEIKLLNNTQVERENIFFITPYIDNETIRQPSKDLMAWKLLKRVFEISKVAKFKRERFISSVLYKENDIVGEGNNYRSHITTTITTTNNNSPNQNSFILNVLYNSLPFKLIAPKSNLISDVKRKIKTRYSIDDDIILSVNGCELDGDDPIDQVLSNEANLNVLIKSTV